MWIINVCNRDGTSGNGDGGCVSNRTRRVCCTHGDDPCLTCDTSGIDIIERA